MTLYPSTSPAQALIGELKTRARLRLNALRGADANAAVDAAAQATPADPRLRDCLIQVSRELGFQNWDQAREALAAGAHRVLLPYRRQFVVVDEHYLRELGLAIDDAAWAPMGRDLVAGYGSAGWVSLCRQRLAATRGDA